LTIETLFALYRHEGSIHGACDRPECRIRLLRRRLRL
jgi:hypothetical protein